MRVSYIGHSGFLAETSECALIFDYWQGELPLIGAGKRVVVFSSHAHADHYNPEIFPLLRERGCREILAVLSRDIPPHKRPEGVETLVVRAPEEHDLGSGMTLRLLHSTDAGVAFDLTTPEGELYHAGDLNDWYWEGEPEADNRQMTGNYRHEMEKLHGRRFKAAFIPLDPRLGGHYARGILGFLRCAEAEHVFPMHYWQQPEVIDRFRRDYPELSAPVRDTEAAENTEI